MIDGTDAATASVIGPLCLLVFLLVTQRRRRPPAVEPTTAAWHIERQGDTYALTTHDSIPQLGIDENTVYGGFDHPTAVALARWLNDEDDRRSYDQVCAEAADARSREVAALEERRRQGGEPVYESGSAEPVDYVDFTEHTFRKMLSSMGAGCDCPEHDYVESPHEADRADIYTESELRAALLAWFQEVYPQHPDWREMDVQQSEQWLFIWERAVALNLKYVVQAFFHSRRLPLPGRVRFRTDADTDAKARPREG